MPRKGRSREFRKIHSGDPERAFWDDFPGRMRTAKVDVLGTGETVRVVRDAFTGSSHLQMNWGADPHPHVL